MADARLLASLRAALAALRADRATQALGHAVEALALAPRDANARKLLMASAARVAEPDVIAASIATLRRAGAFSEALSLAEGATRAWARDAAAWNRLGNLQQVVGRLADAESSYREALALGARDPRLRRNIGVCLMRQDRADEAAQFTADALRDAPEDAAISWSDARVLPLTLDAVADIGRWRSRYLAGLARTAALAADAAPLPLLAEAQDGFLAHYPCRGDDVALQHPLGALYHRLAGRAWPGGAPRPKDDGRVHVGFVSSFFREHTVGRLFSGWLEGLDPARFAVRAWHLGRADAFTRTLGERVPGLEVADATDAGALGQRIRAAGLHVLVYPELGMDVPTLRLAAQRLAPVQAVGWGHPVTTALPSIDAFLSSAWMEPADGDAHYTERLVRLPGLGAAPRDPLPAPRSRDRASLGLPSRGTLLLNTQSVIKLMPDADAAYVAIASRCPEAVFVFLAGDGVQGGAGFRRRISEAFSMAGLDPVARLRFLGALGHADFLDLNMACDLFLDGLGWSGGWTTLEAVSTGLLPVTVEGDRMRSRHTAALLRALGAPELVAPDAQGFVDRVVALVDEPSRRADTAARLRAALPPMLAQARADPGFADWLEGAATSTARA